MYRTLPFRNLPFPRFGLKKLRHRSQKPYRFPAFKEKRLSHRNKKIQFADYVFNHELNRAKYLTVIRFFVKKREP